MVLSKRALLALLSTSAVFVGLAHAAAEPATAAPDVEINGAFPADNPFGNVVNGRQNPITLTFVNHAKPAQDLTVESVSGAFRQLDLDQLGKAVKGGGKWLRNTTALKYGVVVPTEKSVQIPYSFYSEYRPGDIGLTLWVDYVDQDKKKYRALGYESVVTVLEPPASWFDPQLILLYAILISGFGGAGYIVYTTFIEPELKKRQRVQKQKSAASSKKPSSSTDNRSAGAEGLTSVANLKGYDEGWIPEHHLRPRGGKKSSSGAATSEGETSGTDGQGVGAGKGKKTKRR